MAKFLTSSALNTELGAIICDAQKELLLISPYISLHERFRTSLERQRNVHQLEVRVVFGKNETDPSKSVNLEDIRYLTSFPNVEILYESRLHAKFYANENAAILTSMNLYGFSQDNNIEAGIKLDRSFLGKLGASIVAGVASAESIDVEAVDYFEKVAKQATVLFKKTPRYESGAFGLKKTYTHSEIEVDNLEDFLEGNKKGRDFHRGVKRKTVVKNDGKGYCIRSGERIPFNTQRPFSNAAYEVWAEYQNADYPEKYCHFSGEPSFGETSFNKPILRKNWSKAKHLVS